MTSWIHNNDIEKHSTYNERKSVVAKRFIRTLKNRIYECMISILKNVYIDKWTDIVNEYNNNTYHSTMKMKSVDVKDGTFINFGADNNDKDSKFKVGDHIRILKYKTIYAFQKVTFQLVRRYFYDRKG